MKSIVIPLLDGLTEVHEIGFLHRDIKPGNIYIRSRNQTPVLLDFGAARQAVGGKSKSLSIVVSAGYAPAEQYETHGNQGAWTDIYAMAAVMYRAISGKAPVEATARMNAKGRGQPDPLQPAVEVGRGKYSESFLKTVDHGLAVIETDRPQSVTEWGKMFGQPGDTKGHKSRSGHVTENTSRTTSASSTTPKGMGLKWLAAGLLLAFGSGTGWYYYTETKSGQYVASDGAREEEKHQAKEKADAELQAQAKAKEKADAELQAQARAEAAHQARAEEKRRAQSKIVGEFVRVPGGTFEMGCGSRSGCDDNEKPVHTVWVESFEIGRYEVTQGQWKAVMGSNPSEFSSCGEDCPVEKVSWDDAQRFIAKLNTKGQGKYRLPTEAEWEYACRSGGKQEKYSGGNDVDSVAWHKNNSNNKTHRVGQKSPNKLEIYDMSGNVWEWVQDRYARDAYSKHASDNPIYKGSGFLRVRRGSSWRSYTGNARCAVRGASTSANRSDGLGFRLIAISPN